jgi:hypothetical protein
MGLARHDLLHAGKRGIGLATYKLRDVRRRLEEMGAVFQTQKGRPHATVRYGGRVARWPNPHDDPIDDALLNLILRQLGITRAAFFN